MNHMNKLEVLYEDNHIIVVEKPVNILTQSDRTGDIDMLNIIKAYLKEKYNKPGNVYLGLVHRLDRPVSGVMVFAKTSKAASRLSEQIRNKTFEKKYLAVVTNCDIENTGEYVNYLVKQGDFTSKVVDEKNGKYCKLRYQVVEKRNDLDLCLVKIDLETGRHHQIRVQFSYNNHALYGDQRYGMQDKKQIALHAYEISFLHPTTKEKLTFTKYPSKNGVWKEFKSVK